MSNNNLNNNLNKNCSKFKSDNQIVFDSKTKLKDDICNETGENLQNTNINDYMLSNFASCECNLDNVIESSLDNRGIIIKDGYGVSECNVEKDSGLRIGDVERHYKSDLQLFPRPYLTTPLINRGKAKPNLESKLLNAHMIKKHGQMQNVDNERIYTPLVPNLSRTVQAPEHIIQEYVSNDWVRGGIPSRDTVKYLDYMNRSTDSDVIKGLLQDRTKWIQ